MPPRPKAFSRLVTELARLPGIGPKTANRLAFHLLSGPRNRSQALSDALRDSLENVKTCVVCHALSEGTECSICADADRERGLICVVEDAGDLYVIEDSGAYRGLYHVLGGAVSTVEGKGPDDLKIQELIRRVERENPVEVILALSHDAEGEVTTTCLVRALAPTGVTLRRLASGLAYGSRLEFADSVTLSRAMEGRREI